MDRLAERPHFRSTRRPTRRRWNTTAELEERGCAKKNQRGPERAAPGAHDALIENAGPLADAVLHPPVPLAIGIDGEIRAILRPRPTAAGTPRRCR